MRALGEVVLIVVGVLIALLIESGWQDRAERAAERELLQSLTDEFATNAESLDRWLELHRGIAASAEQFIALMEGVPEGSMVSVPDIILAETARTPTYGPEISSLDAALSSGRISLIRSAEVQRMLARWARLLADAQEEEFEGSDVVHRDLLPHLRRVTDLGAAFDWLVSDVERVMQGLPGQARPETSSSVPASPELVNLLWLRYRMASAAANELELLQLAHGELLALLEAELS